jgi:hypothetical protein
VYLGYYILAVHDNRCPARRAERYVQDRSVFRDINLLSSKHGIDPRSQPAFFRQLHEEFEGLVSDAILRIIEVEAHCLRGQALAAFGIIGKELSKMQFSEFLMVRLEGPPSGARGD